MKSQVTWSKELQFTGLSESGHKIVMDGNQGKIGPSPMELVLMAAGGCSSVDVVSILEKARQAVSDCRVELEGTRSDSVPRVYTAIHLHFVVSGKDLSEKHVARAVDLSMEKYCSVSLMLAKAAEVTHSFETVAV